MTTRSPTWSKDRLLRAKSSRSLIWPCSDEGKTEVGDEAEPGELRPVYRTWFL